MNTPSNTQAQTEQNQTKSPIDLQQAFAELLLKRIKKGGHSGQFLAEAFISAYRPNRPFFHGLFDLCKLDTEGVILFKQIIAIRSGAKFNDNTLYQIEQQILAMGEVK